jgi:hypothetical protein
MTKTAINSTNLRKCLRLTRSPFTLPDQILPNSKTAEQTAHEYVISNNCKRVKQMKHKQNGKKNKKIKL